MNKQTLNQVLGVEKELKNHVEKDVTQAYHMLARPDLFEGMNRTYQPVNDSGDHLPPENKKAQHRVDELLRTISTRLTELFDITATKDTANCQAKGDIIVDGEPLVTDVPVPFLLFVEKKLTDMHTVLKKIPVLDPAEEWKQDDNDKLHKSDKRKKVKTQKTPRAIVLHEGNQHGPPQAQLIHEDITVGHWEEQRVSGAFPQVEQKRLLERVEKLQAAVKRAREAGNSVAAPPVYTGAKIFDWLFK